tara:strand:- start:1016 stop:1258 length:243 start_codon:yes stop_codon:yes gene_type:complete
MKRVGWETFNPNESRIMTKVVNRKTGLVFNVDCSINSLLRSTVDGGFDIDEDLALIDCRNRVIEFEGNDDSFLNVLKGKL